MLDFPLTGKHVEAACSGCHIDARSVVDLQSAPTDCVACHQQDDAHDGDLGWIEHQTAWRAPREPGEVRLWAVVRDNRGGVTWTHEDVLVR